MHLYTFLAKITKRSLKMTLLQSISINFVFECIRNIEHSYILKNSSFSLASAEASLYRREAGERKKESARGTMGRGKRRSQVFPSSHRPPRAFYFLIIAIFIRIYPAGACAEKTGSFSLAKALNFVFKAQFRRRTFHEPNLIRIKADPNKNNNNFIFCRHKELKGLPRK